MSRVKRVALFFIFMGLFSTSYQIGALSEVKEEEAQSFLEEFRSLIGEIDALGIFAHNTLVALPMFIPGFGIGWGFFSAWSTGFAFAAIVSLTPQLAHIPPLALLYISPFGIMELVAYSVGISRSYILTWMIIKKQNLRPAMRVTGIEIGIMIGLLLAGGFLENHMITLAEENGFQMSSF
jgi:hypothetical protein